MVYSDLLLQNAIPQVLNQSCMGMVSLEFKVGHDIRKKKNNFYFYGPVEV